MRSSMHRRTAASGESQHKTAESLIRIDRNVPFFAPGGYSNALKS